MFYNMTKQELDKFLRSLVDCEKYHVLAPVKELNHYAFIPLTSNYDDIDEEAITANDFDIHYPISHLSPLKTFLSPVGNVLVHNATDANGQPVWEPAESLKEKKPVVFFGVHPYDIAAMAIVDAQYVDDVLPDPYYVARRERMIVVGLDVIKPPPKSFCNDMDAHVVTENVDIMMTYINDEQIIVETMSDMGQELVDDYGLIQKTNSFVAKISRFIVRVKVGIQYPKTLSINPNFMSGFLSERRNHPHLHETGKDCSECTKCVSVCPTCCCYETEVIPSLDASSGEVVSNSACCLCHNFTRVAGDYVFRPEKGARILNRLMCKGDHHTVLGCTGCGRCDVICPTKIASIPDNIDALLKEEV